jgi:Mn2+/Fe2+ NRAMP family transporter
MMYNGVECVLALGIAFLINVAIISVSASTFYYSTDAGLENAYQLLQILG